MYITKSTIDKTKLTIGLLLIPICFLIAANSNKQLFKNDKLKKTDALDTRWVFTDELTENEKVVHNEISILIDNWWTEFEKNHINIDAVFSKGTDFDLLSFMENNLNNIQTNIFWEFGPAINSDGHRLVITPESYKQQRPLVNEILKRAPEIKDWEFYGYRIPETFEDAINTVNSRTGGQITDYKIQAEANRFNQVNLYFINESLKTESDYNQGLNDAFVAIESLLGEENLDKWIGAIEVINQQKDSLEIKPITELSKLFNSKRNEIKSNLFKKPHYKIHNSVNWSLLSLEPEEQNDYSQQSDIFVAKAINMPMWNTGASGNLFYSERFSNFDETFCYIKLDGTQGLDEEKFEDKSSIEDALDKVLIKENVGCHIGGGTGLKYSYIDLALTDLDKGIKLVKEVLRKGNISKNSWILFYDSELEYEWIGIWDDTPKPLLPEIEE